MKRYIAVLLFLLPAYAFCQTAPAPKPAAEQPYIDVVGTAVQEVIPDRIFVSITLSDKVDNKKEYSIEQQEARLKEALTALGIDLKMLALSDAGSQVINSKRRENVFKVSKEYTLELQNATAVNQVFKALYDIDIKECSIEKMEHSKIDSLRKEVRISAIKAARDKATYLLEAIGEQPGKPLEIKEIEDTPVYRNAAYNYSANLTYKDADKQDNSEFQKIMIRFSYAVRYAIK